MVCQHVILTSKTNKILSLQIDLKLVFTQLPERDIILEMLLVINKLLMSYGFTQHNIFRAKICTALMNIRLFYVVPCACILHLLKISVYRFDLHYNH